MPKPSSASTPPGSGCWPDISSPSCCTHDKMASAYLRGHRQGTGRKKGGNRREQGENRAGIEWEQGAGDKGLSGKVVREVNAGSMETRGHVMLGGGVSGCRAAACHVLVLLAQDCTIRRHTLISTDTMAVHTTTGPSHACVHA
jgi:hypothetical protein